MKASKSEFEKSVIEFVHKKPEEVPSFEQFCVNVTRLLSDLRNGSFVLAYFFNFIVF